MQPTPFLNLLRACLLPSAIIRKTANRGVAESTRSSLTSSWWVGAKRVSFLATSTDRATDRVTWVVGLQVYPRRQRTSSPPHLLIEQLQQVITNGELLVAELNGGYDSGLGFLLLPLLPATSVRNSIMFVCAAVASAHDCHSLLAGSIRIPVPFGYDRGACGGLRGGGLDHLLQQDRVVA